MSDESLGICRRVSHRRRQPTRDEFSATPYRIKFKVRIALCRLHLAMTKQLSNDWQAQPGSDTDRRKAMA